MRTKPSKRGRWKPTRRQMSPWDESCWNLPRLQKWARQAPLVGVFSRCKMWDGVGIIVSLDVRGAGGKILNFRHSFATLHRPTEFASLEMMHARQYRYSCAKMVERVRRGCGQPVRIAPWDDANA